MGFTRHWHLPDVRLVDRAEMRAAFARVCARLNEPDLRDIVVVYEASERCVSFNGKPGDDCETFEIMADPFLMSMDFMTCYDATSGDVVHDGDASWTGYGFCKTRDGAYDVAVEECLEILSSVPGFCATSDDSGYSVGTPVPSGRLPNEPPSSVRLRGSASAPMIEREMVVSVDETSRTVDVPWTKSHAPDPVLVSPRA